MTRVTEALVALAMVTAGGGFAADPPKKLSETGIGAPGVLEFRPQYPLWSDGAAKRRFVFLPPGAAIDGSKPDAWKFPVGTKLWKEFTFGNDKVETRYMVKETDGWKFYSYHWKDQSDAELVEENGRAGVHVLEGGKQHDIPSRKTCKRCHNGNDRDPVLGFSAFQLSDAAEETIPLTSRMLKEKGQLAGMPEELLTKDKAPHIHGVSDKDARVLGYLHANCGHCHRPGGPMSDVVFRHPATAASAADEPVLKLVGTEVVTPGHPETSLLFQRFTAEEASERMPPVGVKIPDKLEADAIADWIKHLP